MYRSNRRFKLLKIEKIHYFFFFQKYQWFYPLIPEDYSLHKIFSMLIIAILLGLCCPTMLRKYDLCKYVNTFKARSQTSADNIIQYVECAIAKCALSYSY